MRRPSVRLPLQRLPLHDAPALSFVMVLGLGLLSPYLQKLALISGEGFLHIRLGYETLAHHALPSVDTFTSTRAGAPYVAHEWGFQVLSYLFYRAFSLDGLVLLAALGWALT